MHHIVCEECKRPYDFDKDDFCPRCGAFNQPVKTWGTDSQGNIIRVDGVNERNHAGSFVHREVHKEKNIRKATGLDWNRKGRAKTSRPAPQPARPQQRSQTAQRQPLSNRIKALLWLIAIIILFNLILPILFALW